MGRISLLVIHMQGPLWKANSLVVHVKYRNVYTWYSFAASCLTAMRARPVHHAYRLWGEKGTLSSIIHIKKINSVRDTKLSVCPIWLWKEAFDSSLLCVACIIDTYIANLQTHWMVCFLIFFLQCRSRSILRKNRWTRSI